MTTLYFILCYYNIILRRQYNFVILEIESVTTPGEINNQIKKIKTNK